MATSAAIDQFLKDLRQDPDYLKHKKESIHTTEEYVWSIHKNHVYKETYKFTIKRTTTFFGTVNAVKQRHVFSPLSSLPL